MVCWTTNAKNEVNNLVVLRNRAKDSLKIIEPLHLLAENNWAKDWLKITKNNRAKDWLILSPK